MTLIQQLTINGDEVCAQPGLGRNKTVEAYSNDCIGGKLGELGVLPVGLASVADLVFEAPMVTTGGFGLAGVAVYFCSGFSGGSAGGRATNSGGRTTGVRSGTAASTGCRVG